MLDSLYSDRPIAISPALAATIGLEDAVMVHVLAELLTFRPIERLPAHPGLDFVLLSEADIGRFFPFWKAADLQRIRTRLMQLDMLVYEPHPEREGAAWYALQRMESARRQRGAVRRRRPATAPIPENWQPDAEWVRQCRQHNIPEDFIHAQVGRFVLYWRDRGIALHSWGNEFCKHVLKQWREQQTATGARERFGVMDQNWRPDEVALDILARDGVSRNFVEDTVAEFVLYWMERGGNGEGAWNTKFIAHVQRQWKLLQAQQRYGGEPQPIPPDWRPDAACLEILQLAEIDEAWAMRQIPEFLLYWRETGEARSSWNTLFLQRLKQLWARRLDGKAAGVVDAGVSSVEEQNEKDDREWIAFHTDRWWENSAAAENP